MDSGFVRDGALCLEKKIIEYKFQIPELQQYDMVAF